MPVDHIRYDILVQQALRGMVRDVLADTAKKGLTGDHHFFVTFDTNAEGVRLSDRLHEQYPDEMTIVLQHQFWDLKVSDKAFEVGLSFGGVIERLFIPLAAIKGFADPSVQFGLQFESLTGEGDSATGDGAGEPAAPSQAKAQTPGRTRPARTSVPASPPTKTAAPSAPAAGDAPVEPEKAPDHPPGDKPGAEVVRLDRFRKK